MSAVLLLGIAGFAIWGSSSDSNVEPTSTVEVTLTTEFFQQIAGEAEVALPAPFTVTVERDDFPAIIAAVTPENDEYTSPKTNVIKELDKLLRIGEVPVEMMHELQTFITALKNFRLNEFDEAESIAFALYQKYKGKAEVPDEICDEMYRIWSVMESCAEILDIDNAQERVETVNQWYKELCPE